MLEASIDFNIDTLTGNINPNEILFELKTIKHKNLLITFGIFLIKY